MDRKTKSLSKSKLFKICRTHCGIISHGGQRLIKSFFLDSLKTVWLVENQNDKEKLIKIFSNFAGESFKYDSVLDKKMIFSDAADKNLVVVLDDFFSNPETFLKLWTGLN